MKKFKYMVFGISYSYGTNSNVLILADIETPERKLPVIVSDDDAKFMALLIENIDTKTISTLKQNNYIKIIDTFGYTVDKIYIHSVVEGKFYCKVYLNNGIDSKEMELSVSDAISLSLSYKSKIYVSEEVINSSSILMDNNGVITKEQEEVNRTQTESTNNSVSNIENLKIALDRAIEEQDFETAAKLRDRIIEIQSI